MPIPINGKIYADLKAAARALKKLRPDIKDPDAYVATIERNITERRGEKAKKKK